MSHFFSGLFSYFRAIRISLKDFLSQPSGFLLFPIKQRLHAFIILTLVAAATFINTLGHQMAYDDEQVIKKNDFVLKGIKGIPDILTHDTYYSFYKNSNLEDILPGGRYRPLSVISFAIEQQIVGTKHDSVANQFIWDVNGNGIVDPDEDTIKDNVLSPDDFYARGLGLRHFMNILLFVLVVGMMFLFFSKFISKLNADVVFLACLIFAVHPIHTEVVANIKSRDELLSLLFIFITLSFVFKYLISQKKTDLILLNISFFLALLSKEYALLLPVLMFVICFLHFKEKLKFVSLLPLFFSIGLTITAYFYLRLSATNGKGNQELFDANIISNPYLLASTAQIFATKIYILLKYIILLFIPYPLISDYSFSTILYRDFSSPEVVVSLMVYVVLISVVFWLILKRNPISLPFIWFTLFLIPIANFVVNIGATMGERLIFHSSVGFCLIISLPIQYFISKKWGSVDFKKNLIVGVSAFMVITFFMLSVQRNKDWENNETLFFADYKKAPNNIVLINSQARNLYLNAERIKKDTTESNKLLRESITLVDKGLNINGAYTPLYQTLALDFFLLKEYDNAVSSAKACLKLDSLDIISKTILISVAKQNILLGLQQFKQKNYTNAISYFDASIKLDPFNTDAYYNKAYCLKKLNDTTNAITLLKKALEIEPKKEIKELLNQLE
jgi:hypothetical protein